MDEKETKNCEQTGVFHSYTKWIHCFFYIHSSFIVLQGRRLHVHDVSPPRRPPSLGCCSCRIIIPLLFPPKEIIQQKRDGGRGDGVLCFCCVCVIE
jgi:hypothetical protein